MTDSRCWVEFKSDRALNRKVAEGWFTDEHGLYLPVSGFPPIRTHWIAKLREWCTQEGIGVVQDDLKIVARVKKAQIVAFVEFAFQGEEHYHDPARMLTWKARAYLAHRLIDLKSFVAKELSPRLWYELVADAG